jgi:membrane protein YdbS with pleckstrin-like domain
VNVGAGEAEVAERQQREPLKRFLRLDLAALHTAQQRVEIVPQARHEADRLRPRPRGSMAKLLAAEKLLRNETAAE